MAHARVSLATVAVIALTLTANGNAKDKMSEGDKGEPQFGFTEDVDVGDKGDRVIEIDTITGLGKRHGRYTATSQSIAAEYTILDNLRIAPHLAFSHHSIRGVPSMDDRIQSAFTRLAFEAKYRMLDRSKAPFGLALMATPNWQRVDDGTGARIESYGLDLNLAVEKELITDRLYAAFNIGYDMATMLSRNSNAWSHNSTLAVAGSLSVPVRPGIFVGAEVRHERTYDGLAVNRLAGDALFVGPHFNAKLTDRMSVIGAWNAQIAGRAGDVPGTLDLTNFERHRVKIKLEIALKP